jgi:hypothetical protein
VSRVRESAERWCEGGEEACERGGGQREAGGIRSRVSCQVPPWREWQGIRRLKIGDLAATLSCYVAWVNGWVVLAAWRGAKESLGSRLEPLEGLQAGGPLECHEAKWLGKIGRVASPRSRSKALFLGGGCARERLRGLRVRVDCRSSRQRPIAGRSCILGPGALRRRRREVHELCGDGSREDPTDRAP